MPCILVIRTTFAIARPYAPARVAASPTSLVVRKRRLADCDVGRREMRTVEGSAAGPADASRGSGASWRETGSWFGLAIQSEWRSWRDRCFIIELSIALLTEIG